MKTALALALVLLTFTTHAADKEPEDIGSRLPSDLRALLIQEMVAVLQATETIVGALVRGEDATVAKEAQAIHDSFILAQQMTGAQREALHKAASPAFLEKDENFHELSASLAEAARGGDKEQQQRIFKQMLDACVECHRQHAADRFPSFQ
ncbi:hypothetical protein ACXYTJ_08435 [Gilvimarinus sp. F26214L]|uniref:hypothetical protein n=1 Tax=Gilvimarinus sp. DZF01 TaxID=3461371 RepID=UPI00404581E7